LGDAKAVNKIFAENAFDAVMHFAAVAYVGESTMEPLRYTSNLQFQTFILLNLLFASGHCLKLFFIEVQFFFVISMYLLAVVSRINFYHAVQILSQHHIKYLGSFRSNGST
jgi:hypothetical protein